MFAEFNLPGIARGYRQAGRKLKPRDSFTEAQLRMSGLRSKRALIRAVAAECAAYGPQPKRPDERKVDKLMLRLSSRLRKAVERLLSAHFTEGTPRMVGMPKLLQRPYDAVLASEAIEHCIQADAK